MKRLATICAVLMCAPLPCFAQGAVQQQGPVIVGHLPMWGGNGRVQDAGGSTGAGLAPANNSHAGTLPTGLGVVNSGLGYCDFSNYASTAYSRLCSGFDGSGNALIQLDRVGGGTPPGFSISINGVVYPFPGAGNGNVVGPVSPAPVSNDLVLWNGSTTVKDGSQAFPSSFPGNVPVDAAQINIGGYASASEIPSGVLQGMVSKVLVPGSYTSVPWPNTAYSAYIANQNPNGNAGASAVGYFGISSIAAANSSVWNFNGIVTNTYPVKTDITGNGLGFDIGTAVGLETDWQLYKNGAAQPVGQVMGVFIIGGGEAGVKPTAGAYGVRVAGLSGGLTPTATWDWAFYTENGAAVVGIDLGTLAAGNNQPSQPILLRAKDSGGVDHAAQINADAAGDLVLGGTTIVGDVFAAITSYNFGGKRLADVDNTAHTNDIYDWAQNSSIILGAAPGPAANYYRNTVHHFQSIAGGAELATISAGGLTVPTLPPSAGGGGLYVCVDTAGVFYKKSACP